MKKHKGWTLIELVLTITLMGIVSVMIFNISYNPLTFKHYRFSQKLVESVSRAKMIELYAEQAIKIDFDNQTLRFSFIAPKRSSFATYHWDLEVPKGTEISNNDFPLILGRDAAAESVVIHTLHHTITIEPRTVYAYQTSKAD